MRMEMQKCKLCWKEFANGKALGGHMRSHLAPLPLPPKTPPQKQDSGERRRGVDPESEFLVLVQETENEIESTRKPTQRRSKRARRRLFVAEENEESADQGAENKEKMGKTAKLAESFSDEENIARCLLMLSNDVWGGSETMKQRKTEKTKENFQCEICNGVFKCSQALGSHRTAHRNKMMMMMMMNGGEFDPEKPRNLGVKIEGHRVHECPFCGKIFGSGQALGGHKRSHSFNSPSGSAGSSSCSSKLDETLMVDSNPDDDVPKTMIDLNFPAPAEEDNQDLSQPQVSVDSELQS